MLIKIQPDATVCRYLFTAKLLYMFRVSQHPSLTLNYDAWNHELKKKKLKQSVTQQVSQIFMQVYMSLIIVKFNSIYFVMSNLSLGVRGPRHHQDITSSGLKSGLKN